jgi:hypothetical protein
VYADALLDRGFFLLNVDSINKSVEVYMVSLLDSYQLSHSDNSNAIANRKR